MSKCCLTSWDEFLGHGVESINVVELYGLKIKCRLWFYKLITISDESYRRSIKKPAFFAVSAEGKFMRIQKV